MSNKRQWDGFMAVPQSYSVLNLSLFSKKSRCNLAFALVDHAQEILTILVLQHRLGKLTHMLFGEPSTSVSDAFKASNLQALALLDDLDEGAGFTEGIVSPGIEPGKSAPEGLHLQFACLQEFLIDSRNLQFAAGGRLDMLGDIHYFIGIEIQSHHGIIAFRFLRFLLD